jgi:hypothetical protein
MMFVVDYFSAYHLLHINNLTCLLVCDCFGLHSLLAGYKLFYVMNNTQDRYTVDCVKLLEKILSSNILAGLGIHAKSNFKASF